MSHLPEQVNLPIAVAFRIVMQGLRIRLGRSLITLFGVLLGIMFLSSTATTFLVQKGVEEEELLRVEVRRMTNFLTAEMGILEGKVLAVIAEGALDEHEVRLIRQLEREGIQRFQWTGPLPAALQQRPSIVQGEAGALAASSDAVLFAGSESPGVEALAILVEAGYTRPVAMTRPLDRETYDGPLYLVALSADPAPEELTRLAAEERTARYRLVWILAIALLVTMMGIANAMLMSVTERFREIGTMKCLGATSKLIRRVFLIESVLIGGSGSLLGALLGALFSIAFHGIIYGFGLVGGSLDLMMLLGALIAASFAGILLTVLAAIYPTSVASSMVPADALRSNV